MLVGAANSGAATEPNTSIYNYDVYYDNADFWFHSDVADATFQCRLDDEPFETCVSPVHYVGLPEGSHRFEVRAVDSTGVVDSSPANLTLRRRRSRRLLHPRRRTTTGTALRNRCRARLAPELRRRRGERDDVCGGAVPHLGRRSRRRLRPLHPLMGLRGHRTGERPLRRSAATRRGEWEPDGLDGRRDHRAQRAAPRRLGRGELGRPLDLVPLDGPAAGTAIFTTEGSSFDTDLAAYTGSAVDSLTIRGWYEPDLNPWTTWSRLELRVEPGHVYSIVVDGQDGATGDVQLSWRMALETGDIELPTVEMWSPQPGASVDGPVTFMADAYDNDSVDRVMYFIQPNGSDGPPWLIGEAREWPYAVDFDTNVLEPGLYSVHVSAVDASGNEASHGFDGNSATKSFKVTVVDKTPPTLTTPSELVADAVSPGGSALEFTATAADRVDGEIVPTCMPTSGSTFAIGDTTVTCHATDASGNTGTASFNVHVKGAGEQLADLKTQVEALALERSVAERLGMQIAGIRKHLAEGRTNAVCGGLADLVAEVQKESGKRLTPEQPERLVADSLRIRAVVAC